VIRVEFLDIKLQRLKQLRKQRPQYAEIYDFYAGLCRFLQEQPLNWLSCTPDLDNWEPRRKNGFPLLTREALQIDAAAASRFICALIASFVEHGQQGEDELNKLSAAVAAETLACDELLTACLEKDRAPLEAAAKELEIPAALVEYVCSTALAFGLQQWRQTAPQPLFDGWQEGYCPLCGAVPAMGELAGDEGKKQLHCSICACDWSVTRLKCSYCGNEESDSLEYFTAEGETGYRVDLCRKCSGYLKVVDSRELGTGLPMDIEDLNTMHLDLLAQKEGFAKGKRSFKDG
jgi:FdhE protein